MSLIELSAQDEAPSHRPLLVLGLLWLLLAAIVVITQVLQPRPITVEWQTETEINAAGFNVYRAMAEAGPYTKINEQLIPVQGGPTAGASYTFVDDVVSPGTTYYYRLEDVELDNSTEQHPPIAYDAPSIPLWAPVVAALCALAGVFLLFRGIVGERKS